MCCYENLAIARYWMNMISPMLLDMDLTQDVTGLMYSANQALSTSFSPLRLKA
jgi:hypothetical protein